MNRSSFDIIGDIGIIEAKTKKEERFLVKKIRSTHPRIKAILKKESESRGIHRVKKYRIVYKDTVKVKASGLATSETIHVQHGCRFKLDIKKTFFNPRNTTIQQSIASQVSAGEEVLVMFAGTAPIPVFIAKKGKAKHITGVEINPTAVAYARENLRLNKVKNVTMIQENVRTYLPKKRFDRIIMPLSLRAYKFLPEAFHLVKKGGTIHIWARGPKEHPVNDVLPHIERAARKEKKSFEIVAIETIRNYSPHVLQVSVTVHVR